ncbi:MAG TPA: cell division protein ZapA [Piscirickettsiaceae bacterium]|nr:cell division protein ZapA [Piscirickettsiaceae bacterium]HIQ40574.1 cell division protein ZapA [Sulfurivirga caldicuralii]
MMNRNTLKITLLNHTFDIPVEPDDEERLIEAATLVDKHLSEARSRSNELKALSVALNLAYDYLLLLEKCTDNAKRVDKAMEEAMQQLAMRQETPDNAQKKSV